MCVFSPVSTHRWGTFNWDSNVLICSDFRLGFSCGNLLGVASVCVSFRYNLRCAERIPIGFLLDNLTGGPSVCVYFR